MRKTSVLILELECGEVVIITSMATTKDTHIVTIDPITGSLHYKGRQGLEVFESEDKALEFITATSKAMVKNTIHGKAILGYANLGSMGLLLIATKLHVSIPKLPCGDCVNTVAETKWVKIPLQNHEFQAKSEEKNAMDLMEIAIDGMYYFCETRDITRPFPSVIVMENPDQEFVWNEWLSSPFKAIGLQNHCVVLLQVSYLIPFFFFFPLCNGLAFLLTTH